ncbi:uncharacterized protein K452DRAFT_324069 [Aplosporella prunicola CBS 121167]|uniref:Tetratricopeptide repeat protein 36 n=1 Tax=Aplosporella prunicola CBS 121167 TaxID=1176127 RepID=A0A6A6BRC3_9PEZI|nr:uncharacterized protein K452DRAFT_324069 [Aplosporella prunicola CBS 121167]KAF2146003.1 hypothetical protein K452DRAFT_324069 [Aplosporella prunicola CBS 121167]
MAATTLTSNDAKVLSALFDPESSPSASVKITPLPQSLPRTSEAELSSLQGIERAAIRPLNTTQPSPESADAAIAALSNLIASHPDYASAYANRAQAIRLKIADDAIFSRESSNLTEDLFANLANTIALATPTSPQDAMSPLQARLLATTHTHRGYLLLKAAKAAREGKLEGGPAEVRGAGQDQLEEMASRDFFFGGRYGDKVAQQLAVKTNPYAKMCGAIVKEAMRKEIAEAMPRIEIPNKAE